MDFAFEFVRKNGGLDTEKDYKYTAEEDKCVFAKERRHLVSIHGYEDVPGSDEQSLLKVQCFSICHAARCHPHSSFYVHRRFFEITNAVRFRFERI